MTIYLTSNSRWYENQCALEASLNQTNFPSQFFPSYIITILDGYAVLNGNIENKHAHCLCGVSHAGKQTQNKRCDTGLAFATEVLILKPQAGAPLVLVLVHLWIKRALQSAYPKDQEPMWLLLICCISNYTSIISQKASSAPITGWLPFCCQPYQFSSCSPAAFHLPLLLCLRAPCLVCHLLTHVSAAPTPLTVPLNNFNLSQRAHFPLAREYISYPLSCSSRSFLCR